MATGYRSNRELAERRKILTVFGVIYAIAIFVIVVLLIMTLSYDGVYHGVYLNQKDVSGMSKEDIRNMVSSQTNEALSNSTVYFTYHSETVGSLTLSDLQVNYNADAIVDAVYNPGHEGSVFERLSDILTISNQKLYVDTFDAANGTTLAQYDETGLKIKVNEIASLVASDTIQHNFTMTDGALRIIAGRAGVTVDKDVLQQKILEAAAKMETVSYIELSDFSQEVKPDAFDVQKVYDTYNIPAANAKYVRNGSVIGGTVSIMPERDGQSIQIGDLVTVSQTIETSPDTVYTVPVTPVAATVKATELAEPVFTETISSFTTEYSSSSPARKTNIQLATATIDGYILLPGETFSFNGFVGDTTIDKGYALSGGYEGGEQVQTPGGGVCQVSTTLYNAALQCGMEITDRYCHSMPVTYVPRGMDAAVSYGVKDLKLTNNFNVPIKIVGTTTNSKVTFKIMGVNQNKHIKYSYSATKINEFTSEGLLYYVYQTYRTVTVNGKVTEDKKEFNRSTYLIN